MKKILCILMSMIIVFSNTSCKGSKQQVEKLALVMATGLDLTPDNKYKLTVQILNVENGSSKSTSSNKNGQQDSTDVTILTSMGDSPYDVINHLSTDYGKNIFLGHSKYMVVGKRLAESGLSLFVDAIIRGQQGRPDSILLLAKDKASDILAFQPVDERTPVNSVNNLIKLQSTRGYSPIVSRLDFVNALSSKTAAPIMGVIDINRKNNREATFNLFGTGIFHKEKLIGYLDMNETRGMQWIKGKVKDGIITTSSPDGNKVSFFLLSAVSKIKPIVENDLVTIQITIKAKSNVLEMLGKGDPIKNPKIMDDLAKLQSKAIEKEVELALNAAQKKFNADIFDFGGLIHKEYPKSWKNMKDKWDDIFPNINIEVTVISDIESPGVISKPID